MEWVTSLIAHAPSLVTDRLMEGLVQVWRTLLPVPQLAAPNPQLTAPHPQLVALTPQLAAPSPQLAALLSPTTTHLLARSGQPEDTWHKVGAKSYRRVPGSNSAGHHSEPMMRCKCSGIETHTRITDHCISGCAVSTIMFYKLQYLEIRDLLNLQIIFFN